MRRANGVVAALLAARGRVAPIAVLALHGAASDAAGALLELDERARNGVSPDALALEGLHTVAARHAALTNGLPIGELARRNGAAIVVAADGTRGVRALFASLHDGACVATNTSTASRAALTRGRPVAVLAGHLAVVGVARALGARWAAASVVGSRGVDTSDRLGPTTA